MLALAVFWGKGVFLLVSPSEMLVQKHRGLYSRLGTGWERAFMLPYFCLILRGSMKAFFMAVLFLSDNCFANGRIRQCPTESPR